jgi:hypothetical protein
VKPVKPWTVPDWVREAKTVATDDYTVEFFTKLAKNAKTREERQQAIQQLQQLGMKRTRDLGIEKLGEVGLVDVAEKAEVTAGRKSLKFTVPPREQYKYGVWTNYGGFKTHRSLGAAKQSAQSRGQMWGRQGSMRSAAVITELIDGEWYILFEVPEGTTYNDLPWVKEEQKYDGYDSATYRAKYRTVHRARPMTREEYAEWRVAVELEKRGIVETTKETTNNGI